MNPFKRKDAAEASEPPVQEKTRRFWWSRKQKEEKPPKKPRKIKVVNINDDSSIRPRTIIWRCMATLFAWACLLFFVVCGAFNLLKPDPLAEYRQMTNSFIAQQQAQKNREQELYAFAENFAQEYCTYEQNGLSEYTGRVGRYTASAVNFAGYNNFRGDATATYASAYSMEEYADGQYDVYVRVLVTYRDTVREDNETVVMERTGNTYMKVPVRELDSGGFVVEDYPLMVAAPAPANASSQQFTGKEAEQAAKTEVENLVDGFLGAWYSGNQTSIEYFLSSDADKSGFTGLDGRFALERISSVKTWNHPGEADQYITVVEASITDLNGQNIQQRFHLLIRKEGQRYYILQMDTRSVDLKYITTN